MTDNPFDEMSDEMGQEPGDPEATAKGPLNRLFDGTAQGPSVGELQSQYGFDFHWAVAARGFIRSAVGDGVPPIMEIVTGTIMGVLETVQGGDGFLEKDPGDGNESQDNTGEIGDIPEDDLPDEAL